MSKTSEKIQRVFPELLSLIQEGEFDKRDAKFMVTFLEKALQLSRELLLKIEKKEST